MSLKKKCQVDCKIKDDTLKDLKKRQVVRSSGKKVGNDNDQDRVGRRSIVQSRKNCLGV